MIKNKKEKRNKKNKQQVLKIFNNQRNKYKCKKNKDLFNNNNIIIIILVKLIKNKK